MAGPKEGILPLQPVKSGGARLPLGQRRRGSRLSSVRRQLLLPSGDGVCLGSPHRLLQPELRFAGVPRSSLALAPWHMQLTHSSTTGH